MIISLKITKNIHITKDRFLENRERTEKEHVKLVAKSKTMFEGLKKKRVTTKKKKNYFKLDFEKPTNVGKLYLLLNIHKTFSNLLGHPVILSSGIPTKKLFGILRSSFAASNEKKNILHKI